MKKTFFQINVARYPVREQSPLARIRDQRPAFVFIVST
jgi:hypothetical protein